MPILKLKTGGGQAQAQSHRDGAAPPSAGPATVPARASPAPNSASTTLPRLKLKATAPPTPATDQPTPLLGAATAASKKQPAQRKTGGGGAGRKRTAKDDISPAAKRIASERQAIRRPSLKLKPGVAAQNGHAPVATSAITKLKIAGPKKQITPRIKALTTHNIRREPPKRETGVGYDSEDSEREEDPSIQQGLILRMQPGEDADILHHAIAEGKIGAKENGGVEASIKFVTNDLRRAVVKVRGHMYAAALVDLPCIVESMKSWDKKGWWKVADVCQMLLVLGPVQNEAQIRDYPLPREVNKETMQYAHGLTPPMHYVRKRRFRKRVSHRQMENVEEEVERLLREDDEWEKNHGKVTHQEYAQGEWDRIHNAPAEQQEYDEDMDAEGEAVDTVEDYDDGYGPTPEEEDQDTAALEAELAAELADDAFAEPEPAATDLVVESPAPLADQAASFSAVEENVTVETPVETPAATPAGDGPEPMTQDEESDEDESDYDDGDDEGSSDVVDEDAVQRAAEKAQQLEEVADLEREIAAARTKANSMGNQLLKKREMDKLSKLEGDLKMKRAAFELDADADE